MWSVCGVYMCLRMHAIVHLYFANVWRYNIGVCVLYQLFVCCCVCADVFVSDCVS